jgi:signal transduction histidine kinase/CheY-like chemotaxis protein
VVVLDGDLRIRFANPAYAAAYPEEHGPLAGMLWLESGGRLWHQPVIADALERLRTDGGDIAMEVELAAGGASHRTVALTGGPLRWPHDPRHHILLTLVDVTAHARLLEQAGAARFESERANRAKDIFLAILSHELRAPLHTITLHVDLLLAAAGSDAARVQRAGEAIGRAAAAQEQIISDLLDVSAIVAGKIAIKRVPVEVPVVIAAALDMVRERAAAKQVALRDESRCGPALVLGDPTRLQQIVVNLLTNAVKFTPAGGHVTISASHDGERVRVTVADTGQGIAPDFLAHAFDRFAQADTSNARMHGGLGLGLAIVKDLARLHGGSVRAASDGLGKGAAFTVELPLVSTQTLAGRVPEEETSPWGHDVPALEAALRPSGVVLDGIKVLVVDDDGEAREVLSDILVHHGAEVRSVGRAAEVLPALSEFRPDVLLCDIAMPEEDGYSLLRRVRALAPTAGGQTPAIAVTALATRSDRKRALAAGFQLHVAKPTPVAILCAAVRQLHAGGRN